MTSDSEGCDRDGVADQSDNCPTISNADQADYDSDGVGNACDLCPNDATDDADVEGSCQDVDICPNNFNPGQEDFDSDGIGNPCDDDRDGDGLPNAWEQLNGLSADDNGSGALTNGAAGDQDGDQASNFDEFIADTNPNQSSSVFRVKNIIVNSPPTLTWSSSAARVYRVDYNTSLLSSAWSPLASSIVGSNGLISVTDTNNANLRNYRLNVGFPP